MSEIPRPPLRMLVVVAAMAILIAYETNPGLQSWVSYKLVQAREWIRYGREWLAYKQRQRRA